MLVSGFEVWKTAKEYSGQQYAKGTKVAAFVRRSQAVAMAVALFNDPTVNTVEIRDGCNIEVPDEPKQE